jgi:hypothetical protein
MPDPTKPSSSLIELLEALKDKDARRLVGYALVLNALLVVLTAFLTRLEDPFPVIFGVILFALVHLFAQNKNIGHYVFTYALAFIFIMLAILYVGKVIRSQFPEMYDAITSRLLQKNGIQKNFSQKHFGTEDFYNNIASEYNTKLASIDHQAEHMTCDHAIRFYYISNDFQAGITQFTGIKNVGLDVPAVVPVVSEDLKKFIKKYPLPLLQWDSKGSAQLRDTVINSGTSIPLNTGSISAGWLHHFNDQLDSGEFSWFLIPLDGCENKTEVDVYVALNNSKMAQWHPNKYLWEINTGEKSGPVTSLEFTSSVFFSIDNPCSSSSENSELHDILAKFKAAKPTGGDALKVLNDLKQAYDFDKGCFVRESITLYKMKHVVDRSTHTRRTTLVLVYGIPEDDK